MNIAHEHGLPARGITLDRERVIRMVASLSRNQATVLIRRFGLDGMGGMSQAALARELRVSHQRIFPLERQGLTRLRAMIVAERIRARRTA